MYTYSNSKFAGFTGKFPLLLILAGNAYCLLSRMNLQIFYFRNLKKLKIKAEYRSLGIEYMK